MLYYNSSGQYAVKKRKAVDLDLLCQDTEGKTVSLWELPMGSVDSKDLLNLLIKGAYLLI